MHITVRYVVCLFQKYFIDVINFVSGPTMCTDHPFQLLDQAFFIFRPSKGPKKEQKRAKIGIFRIMTIWEPLFNETGWKEVGGALKESRLIS